MRRFRAFVAMILIISSVLVLFYSTFRLETTFGHKVISEEALRQRSPQVGDGDVKTQSSPQEVVSTPSTDVYNVTVSAGLKETIPWNEAYWNRRLYLTLQGLDRRDVRVGRSVPWALCRETNRELLQTNIHDFSSYPVLLQTFVEGMGCRSPPVLIHPPNKCDSAEDGDHAFLLFAIKSSPGNFVRRQAVRETWAREGVYEGGLRVHTVFLLGSSTSDDPDLTVLLGTEGNHFGDLLQWDFHESFLNLTLKMNAFLEWSLRACPHVSFVFSGDDDVFVNTPVLLRHLQSQKPPKVSQLYFGHVITSASPHRDPKSKYYVPPSFYEGPYPAYAGGGGFLFSGALLRRLHLLSHIVPFFPIDDVYMGMCFKALGASPELHAGFQTFDVKDKDRENLCVHKSLVLVHQRTPKQLKKLWRGIRSPLLSC